MSGLRYGTYLWSYASGSFPVVFRPFGVFYCAKYPAQASWQVINGNQLIVDWKKFGVYQFQLTGGASLEGHAQNNPGNWRKIEFMKDFSETDRLLLADGFGSVWNFQYEKGSFEVEFRVDAYNHFVCKQYPAHSHWTLNDDDSLYVNWGQYGEYMLRLEPGTNTLVGHKKDQPENWRRVSFVRALAEEEATSVGGHDHSHSHAHGEGCGSGDCHKEHCDSGSCSHDH